MGQGLHKLSDLKVKSNNLKVGRHSDGGGLYLNVKSTGSKSWLFMWVVEGKRREMGLGPYPAIGLSAARDLAKTARTSVAAGGDPIEERRAQPAPLHTFGESVTEFLASKEKEWSNPKHRAQWKMTLEVYGEALLTKPVASIDTADVLDVLNPIWSEKPETASRLQGRIERVLDAAKAKGHRTGENPARWRGHLQNLLASKKKLTRGHHAALPYDQVRAFMQALRKSEAMAARCLEFTILTAARSQESLGARWSEFDLVNGLWTIPGVRMKARRSHVVPLTPQVLTLLADLGKVRVGEYVFPGQKFERPLSSHAMEMLLRRLKSEITIHGFRSSFKDWASEETSFARELSEMALAHLVGDATEQAYRRGKLLRKRRKLMNAWANYILPAEQAGKSAKVAVSSGRTAKSRYDVNHSVKFPRELISN